MKTIATRQKGKRMSKSVLISINPKWCELIASGKKTVEVRKTKPKLETPFKVYIYCTNGAPYLNRHNGYLYLEAKDTLGGRGYGTYERLSGKVIGEFLCNEISELYIACDVHGELPSRPCEYWLEWDEEHDIPNESCLTVKEIMSYLGRSDYGYAWHISDLVIYDKPRELSEFYKPCVYGEDGDVSCFLCDKSGYRPDMHIDCFNKVTRPPMSWCYVEE